MKSRILAQYIFFQMVPSFILGIIVFISILLMFQALRLTEFVLVHGVELMTLVDIMGYLSISFLPALLPMSLLFAVLMTYGRLSGDSEIVAMKSSGLSLIRIMQPAVLLGLVVALLSAQTSFVTAPWGNRQFEVLITRLGSSKATIQIREGTFSEGFFDLVVYANEVDNETGELKKVFIYDEKSHGQNLTIVAQSGRVLHEQTAYGNEALLRLKDGQIHRKGESHTTIKFESYDFQLADPIRIAEKKKTMPSLTYSEINERLERAQEDSEIRLLKTEYHKRWAVAVACLIFALLGVGLGTTTNRRNAKSSGIIVSLVVVVVYWALYISMESMARSGSLAPAIAIWIPNTVFALASLYYLKRANDS